VFISSAYAQGAAGGVEGQLLGFLPIILMFVVLYFLMIRPQMKRAKDHKTMLGALQKGDEVITAGGLVGRINKVGDGYVTVEVAHQGDRPIEMQFQKASVQTLLPRGTIKAI